MTKPFPLVSRIAANEKGRDFIVGDIHGAYNSVLAAMKDANFNSDIDRIFSVGDLIDRGPDSARCIKFLALPYVFAIRGNHEEWLLELYADGPPEERVLQAIARMKNYSWFSWWLDTPMNKREEILSALKQLPYVIELQTQRGTVGLVHADIPANLDWPTFINAIEAKDSEVLETALWGRTRIESNNKKGVKGVDRVFVGHTPQWNGVTQFANVFCVDTGAIFRELGLKEVGQMSFVAATAVTSYLIEPRPCALINVRDDLSADNGPSQNDAPFGNYVEN